MKAVESLLSTLPSDYIAGPHVRLAGERDHTIGDEYEVRVLSTARGRQLVSVIELVSPSCKNCPASRQAFAAQCAAFLREQVSATLVDIVTVNEFNFYRADEYLRGGMSRDPNP
jgi:hypothetical protein